MQTIGEKLEEARKQKGITIREAAEVTKIRGEFLAHFENNHFDLNLPEIYARGFVKLYAKYLGLDPEQIGVEYNAHRLGGLRVSSRRDLHSSNPRESLGRIEVEDNESAVPSSSTAGQSSTGSATSNAASAARSTLNNDSASTSKSFGHIPFSNPPKEDLPGNSPSLEDIPTSSFDKAIYWKAAAVIAASVIALVFVILLISLIVGGDSSENTSENQTSTQEQQQPAQFPQTLRFIFAAGSGDLNYASFMFQYLDNQGNETGKSPSSRIGPGSPQIHEINSPVNIPYIINGGRLSIVLPNGETIDSVGIRGIISYDGRRATVTQSNR